jgi:isopentenyl-diphosphate delta-isomerase
MEELILVDTRDQAIGSCEKIRTHKKGLLHRAFSVFLYSGDQMLLQKRSREKYHSGGLWTNACCSHPRTAETVAEAVSRRLQEELHISAPVFEAFSFIYYTQFPNQLIEYEYDHVLLGEYGEMPEFNPEEAEEMRWVRFDALREALLKHPEQFTIWFLIAAPRVLNLLESGHEGE